MSEISADSCACPAGCCTFLPHRRAASGLGHPSDWPLIEPMEYHGQRLASRVRSPGRLYRGATAYRDAGRLDEAIPLGVLDDASAVPLARLLQGDFLYLNPVALRAKGVQVYGI